MRRDWAIPAVGIVAVVVALVAALLIVQPFSSPPVQQSTPHFGVPAPASTTCSFNQTQTITITGTPTSYTLSLGTSTTPSIFTTDVASTIQGYLAALSTFDRNGNTVTVGANNVVVTGSAGGPYTVSFFGIITNSVQKLNSTVTGTGTVVTPVVANDQTTAFAHLINTHTGPSPVVLPPNSCWEIDGSVHIHDTGATDTTLTAAVPTLPTTVTALTVATAGSQAMPTGARVTIGSGASTQVFTTNSPTAAHATSISVVPQSANFAYPIGTVVIAVNYPVVVQGNGATLVQTVCQASIGAAPILFATNDVGLTIQNLTIFGAIGWPRASCAGGSSNNGPNFEKAAGIYAEAETNLTLNHVSVNSTQGDGLVLQEPNDFSTASNGLFGDPLNTNVVVTNSNWNLGTGGYHCLVVEAVGPTAAYPQGGAQFLNDSWTNCPTEWADFEADLVQTPFGADNYPQFAAQDNVTVSGNTMTAWGKPWFASIQAFNQGVQEQNLRLTGNHLHNSGAGSGPGSIADIEVTPACCDSGPSGGSPIGPLTSSLSTTVAFTSIPVTTSGSIDFPSGAIVNISQGTHNQQFTSSGTTTAGSTSITVPSQKANFTYTAAGASLSWSIPPASRYWSKGWVIENNTLDTNGSQSTDSRACDGSTGEGQAMLITGLVDSIVANNTFPVDYGATTGGCPGNPYNAAVNPSYNLRLKIQNNNFTGAEDVVHGVTVDPFLSHCGNSSGVVGNSHTPFATESAC